MMCFLSQTSCIKIEDHILGLFLCTKKGNFLRWPWDKQLNTARAAGSVAEFLHLKQERPEFSGSKKGAVVSATSPTMIHGAPVWQLMVRAPFCPQSLSFSSPPLSPLKRPRWSTKSQQRPRFLNPVIQYSQCSRCCCSQKLIRRRGSHLHWMEGAMCGMPQRGGRGVRSWVLAGFIFHNPPHQGGLLEQAAQCAVCVWISLEDSITPYCCSW